MWNGFPVQENDNLFLGLIMGITQSLLALAIFDDLDSNFSTPFRCIKIFQELTIFPSNINIDIRDIYFSLNAIRVSL
jgi:hypothetical protein